MGGVGHHRCWCGCGHFGGPLATGARSSGAFGTPEDAAQREHYKAPQGGVVHPYGKRSAILTKPFMKTSLVEAAISCCILSFS